MQIARYGSPRGQKPGGRPKDQIFHAIWSDPGSSSDSLSMNNSTNLGLSSPLRATTLPFPALRFDRKGSAADTATGPFPRQGSRCAESSVRNQQLMEIDRESHAHAAVHHIWLENVAARRYVDMESTLRDFARDYYAYSSGFPIYLQKLIAKLEHAEHRELLERNLREEQGGLDRADSGRLREAAIDTADVDGVSHRELYRRFCRALGLDDAELGLPGSAGHLWRQRMIAFLDSASPAAALGALGPGTEGVVRPIYRKLLRGIRELSAISARDRVFFELHYAVDDQHRLDLMRVAYDLIGTPGARNDMRQGMLEALQLRQDFFTHQQLHPSARLIGEPA